MGCIAAPFSHQAEALFVATLRRPCGHEPGMSPRKGTGTLDLCRTHAIKHLERPVAGRATACPICGEVNLPALISIRPLEPVLP